MPRKLAIFYFNRYTDILKVSDFFSSRSIKLCFSFFPLPIAYAYLDCFDGAAAV